MDAARHARARPLAADRRRLRLRRPRRPSRRRARRVRRAARGGSPGARALAVAGAGARSRALGARDRRGRTTWPRPGRASGRHADPLRCQRGRLGDRRDGHAPRHRLGSRGRLALGARVRGPARRLCDRRPLRADVAPAQLGRRGGVARDGRRRRLRGRACRGGRLRHPRRRHVRPLPHVPADRLGGSADRQTRHVGGAVCDRRHHRREPDGGPRALRVLGRRRGLRPRHLPLRARGRRADARAASRPPAARARRRCATARSGSVP